MYPEPIVWKLHLQSPIAKVYEALDSDEGRARFWAESARELDNTIHFEFINGVKYAAIVLLRQPPYRFEIDYFNSRVSFELKEDKNGGTDLQLTNSDVPWEDYEEVYAGWLSVLFALKGFVDFGIDLRNHDKSRTWDDGFIEN